MTTAYAKEWLPIANSKWTDSAELLEEFALVEHVEIIKHPQADRYEDLLELEAELELAELQRDEATATASAFMQEVHTLKEQLSGAVAEIASLETELDITSDAALWLERRSEEQTELNNRLSLQALEQRRRERDLEDENATLRRQLAQTQFDRLRLHALLEAVQNQVTSLGASPKSLLCRRELRQIKSLASVANT